MTDKDLEIARLREALQQSKKEVKSLKGKLSTAKAKAEKAREEVKSLKKKTPDPSHPGGDARGVSEHVRWHHSPESLIRVAVLLRTRVKVGGRSIVKIMKTFNEVYDGVLGKIPCANTIDLWTSKCGLDTYNQNAAVLRDQEYCEIMDESMMIGSNKLVLTLAAPAEHLQRPLTHSDVAVIGIDTAESFNAEKIRQSAVKSAAKVGHAPVYVITDNARAMIKGVSDAGYRRHADITHTLGVFLERTYKDEEDFKEFCKLMSDAQFQHNMKRVAYLMPPRQRTVSRFINLDNWVKWSLKVLDVYHRLESAERAALGFVPAHASHSWKNWQR